MINIEDNRKSPLCRIFEDEGKYRDLQIRTRKQARQPIHMNDVLEIIYVHHGTARIRVSFDDYEVHENEFMVINIFELHSVESLSDDTVVSSIRIGRSYYHYEDGLIVWWTGELGELQEYRQLAEQIRTLVHIYHEGAPASTVHQVLTAAVQRIVEQFRLEVFGDMVYHSKKVTYVTEKQLERYNKLYMYLYTHYDEKITLDTICRELYLSKYYLSRYIRSTMGGTLTKTLGMIRSEKAEIKLLEGNRSLGTIATECGFSSAHYFNNTFRDAFGCSPTEYRRTWQQKTIMHSDFTGEELGSGGSSVRPPAAPRIDHFPDSPDAKAGSRLLIELPEGMHTVTLINEEDPSGRIESHTVGQGELCRIRLFGSNQLLLIKENSKK